MEISESNLKKLLYDFTTRYKHNNNAVLSELVNTYFDANKHLYIEPKMIDDKISVLNKKEATEKLLSLNKSEQINAFLVNAIKYLDNEQKLILIDNLQARMPKKEINCPYCIDGLVAGEHPQYSYECQNCNGTGRVKDLPQ